MHIPILCVTVCVVIAQIYIADKVAKPLNTALSQVCFHMLFIFLMVMRNFRNHLIQFSYVTDEEIALQRCSD